MSFEKEIPQCHRCGGIALSSKGVIYVRVLVKDEWGSHPVCDKCWYDGENREPIRVKSEAFTLV